MLVATLMFPALFALILLGLPIAFSLTIVSVGAGLAAFGPAAFNQLYGSFYSASTNFILSAIPMFILMGALLERSGVAERLFRVMSLWLGRLPGGIGHRMARLQHPDGFARRGVAVARDHRAGERPVPQLLERGCELGGALARADDDRSAFGFLRQRVHERAFGIGAQHRRLEQAGQEVSLAGINHTSISHTNTPSTPPSSLATISAPMA